MEEGITRNPDSRDQEKAILQTLVENLPDGIFLKDNESRFIFANQVVADLMGAPDPQALLGKTDHDFYPKEVADIFLKDERVVIETRRSLVNREESDSASGRLRWLTTKVPVIDSRGQVTGLLGIARNITERHEAEEALRRSEQSYRDLMEQAADGIFLLDENYNFLSANSELCRMSGYAREELLGLNILATYPEEWRDGARARNDRIRSGEKLSFERPFKRKDGTVFAAELSARRRQDGTMQGIARDITERKRTESELDLERSLLGNLLENIPDSIYFKDAESRFIRTSRAHARLFGLRDAKEAIGKTDMDFFSGEHARNAYQDEQRIVRTGEALLNVEEKETWPNRPDTWALTTKLPLRDQDGQVIGTFGISHDITERRESEEALRRSEQRYRSLLEQATDGIFLLDENGSFLVVNPEICTMLGYPPEELTGLNILDTYTEEFRDEGKARIEGIKHGETLRFERLMKRRDGSVFPVEISAGKLADGTQQSIVRDISERKRLAQSLDAERELLQTLIDSLPDLVFVKDRQSRFVLVNRSLAVMAGASDPKEVIGKSDRDFSPAVLADKYMEDDRTVMETARSKINSEEVSTSASGSSRWVITTKVPIVDRGGTVTGLVGISRDITERKRAEQRLESLARFSDESPQPVMRVTPDGSISYSNKASDHLTSSWAGGAEGRIPEAYLHDVILAWKTGEKKEIEVHEAMSTYLISIVPFTDAGYINLYGRDVTEEKALAERLTQAQKMESIGQLTGGIAHDFNNVLQAISGYCEVLKQRIPQENQKYLAEITKAANRAAALTARLLAFSRKQIYRPQVVNTIELIGSIHKMLERVIGEDIDLQTHIDPDTGNFLADPGQVDQVLMNLAVNARDAMPSGGMLTIETSNCALSEAYVRDHPAANEGEYVRLVVSDTGVGMDQGTLAHIYEPFFTTKEIGKGTGLGLSIVYGVVKQSGGYITCTSEIRKGTTFTIYLPLIRGQTKAPPAAVSGRTAPGGTETILLVDDDLSIRRVARMMLEEAGYVVLDASGGEEALSIAAARWTTISLLVTDVVMPRMSGKELAHRLQAISPKLQVLYVSGYTADVISNHGILDTGVDYLGKPFRSQELLTKVRQMLDRQYLPPVAV